MRTGLFITYSLIASLVFFSCSRSDKLTETSPKFSFVSDSVFTTYKDTLRIRGSYSNNSGFYMDSIAAGDTAAFMIDVDGVFHTLTEINISLSPGDSVAEILFPDNNYKDSLFSGSSDFEQGILYPATENTRVPLRFLYSTKKASKDITLNLTAYSEASDENNTNHFTLKVPVKRTPAPVITVLNDTIYTTGNDTLIIRSNQLQGFTVGQTASFTIHIDGVRNRLKKFILTPATANDSIEVNNVAEIILPDKAELDGMFLDTSDYENRIFEMDSTLYTFTFSFKVRAKEADGDFSLKFEAHSDALYDYGIGRFELKAPVRNIPDEEEEEDE